MVKEHIETEASGATPYEETYMARLTKNPRVLTKLYESKEITVRKAVAANKHTPKGILMMLSKDESLEVRRVTASNKNAPRKARENGSGVLTFREWNIKAREYAKTMGVKALDHYSSKDSFGAGMSPVMSVMVRVSSSKPVTQMGVQELMTMASKTKDAKEMNVILKEAGKIGKDNAIKIKVKLAGNNKATSALLIKLAKTTNRALKLAITHNKNTPKTVLKKFSVDKYKKLSELATKKLGKKVSSASPKDVATTIIKQLGGSGKLNTMIGMKNAAYGDEGRGHLTFRFKGSRKANSVKIVLTGKDLYDITFYKIGRGVNIKEVKTFDDVFADQLIEIFESFTGLYLSL